jgi:hypothetical protein
MESKLKNKKLLDEIEKSIDDIRNNQFATMTGFQLQAIQDKMPNVFSRFHKDRTNTTDGGARAFLGQNKRRRKRDVIKKPENVVGTIK